MHETGSKRATREDLVELWSLLAHYLLDTLRDAQPGSLKASLINVARAFLADNGVSVESIRTPGDGAEALSGLLGQMPDFGERSANTGEPKVWPTDRMN